MARQHLTTVSGRLAGQVVALLVVLVGSPLQAQADRYHLFPGKALDGRTVSAQHKVESLYSSGDFARAFLIYRKELAPIGDKYAQYMVGYMRLNGQGVERHPPEALAWYRLAAERGESVLSQARDALLQSLDEAERAEADRIFARLWQQYGDRKLLLELIREDLVILRSRVAREHAEGTSQSPAEGRPRMIIASGYMGSGGDDGVYRRVRERLDRRLAYLEHAARFESADNGAGNRVIEALESEVRRNLEALEIRQ
jgi:hypothetical protein